MPPNDQSNLAPQDRDYELDPIFLSSRREAVVVLAIFALFTVYVLGVSFMLGAQPANPAGQGTPTMWGMPSWVVWGIVVPWVAANVVTAWFCFWYMKVEDLGSEGDGEIDLEEVHG
ncbi:MAG: hypothetical protein KDA45_10920 [Planctomycetales bacterium]|nr:hypothetical protein [Planctomycetales bacterium]